MMKNWMLSTILFALLVNTVGSTTMGQNRKELQSSSNFNLLKN